MRNRAIVAIVAALLGYGEAGSAPLCAITALEGSHASVERDGMPVALTPGVLQASDRLLQTGPGTRLQVTCDDGTVVSVGPESRVNLADLLTDPGDEPSVVVQLLQGIAGFVRPETAQRAFEVQTPVAVAAVRSTEWLVEHAADTGSSVFVRRGRVVVSNAAQSFVLETGQGVTLTLREVVKPVALWGSERIERSTSALGLAWD